MTDLFHQPDFTTPTLRRHNNTESEDQVLDNVHHFAGQTKWVYEQLLKGRRLNGLIALQERGIMDLRARIHSIRKADIRVDDVVVPGANGMKEYFLPVTTQGKSFTDFIQG